jgi:CheY-like chemotaxis protein
MKGRLVILVAEDNPHEAELLHLAMNGDGMHANVQEVKDGQEAIDYLRGYGEYGNRLTHPFPDLLLLDLQMPGRSGLDVLKWMQTHPQCNRLPKVMLSSSDLDGEVEQAYRLGANSFFQKPMGFKEFQRLLKTIVDYWGRSERPRVAGCGEG